MGERFSRQEVLSRLRKSVDSGRPIIVGGGGTGLVAKCAELAGIDLILISAAGIARQKGLASVEVPAGSNQNEMVLGVFEEISNATHNTPIVCSIEAGEPPASRDLTELVKRFIDVGYSGVINHPSAGLVAVDDLLRIPRFEKEIQRAREKEAAGLGFSREVEMIRICRNMDIFTICYVFTPAQARLMAEVGVDCVVGHCGPTTGGFSGHPALRHKEAVGRLQKMFEAANEVNSDIFLMAHGGPLENPEDTKYLYENTDAVGFVGGSSIERIPVERAVIDVVGEFKSISLRNRGINELYSRKI